MQLPLVLLLVLLHLEEKSCVATRDYRVVFCQGYKPGLQNPVHLLEQPGRVDPGVVRLPGGQVYWQDGHMAGVPVSLVLAGAQVVPEVVAATGVKTT